MKHTNKESLVEYIEMLMDLAQWACSEGWEEIEKTTEELINRLINKEQNT
jgi:DNA-binding protein YbaB